MFEVKNSEGQTIFAVYDGGVRVYVSDSEVKGIKGGFAVTGFGDAKGETDLLVVSPDSYKGYILVLMPQKELKADLLLQDLATLKVRRQIFYWSMSIVTRVYIGVLMNQRVSRVVSRLVASPIR